MTEVTFRMRATAGLSEDVETKVYKLHIVCAAFNIFVLLVNICLGTLMMLRTEKVIVLCSDDLQCQFNEF